jgi:LysM repeat protein
MAGRSPARFLAPLALVAFAIALLMVVSNASQSGSPETTATPATSGTAKPASSKKHGSGKTRKRHKRSYTVKSGDTPSGIAEATGVPLSELLALNPDLDPQSLTVGQKLRLRRWAAAPARGRSSSPRSCSPCSCPRRARRRGLPRAPRP